MRYNRGSITSTMAAARAAAAKAGEPRYVHPTAAGFRIDRQAPPFGERHYCVQPNGAVALVNPAGVRLSVLPGTIQWQGRTWVRNHDQVGAYSSVDAEGTTWLLGVDAEDGRCGAPVLGEPAVAYPDTGDIEGLDDPRVLRTPYFVLDGMVPWSRP